VTVEPFGNEHFVATGGVAPETEASTCPWNLDAVYLAIVLV
jgi:hypothetical protein